jgi:hypothetical protein
MHNTCHRRLSCWRKRFKILLEVAALDVVAPFMMALNGDVPILSPAMVDDLVMEVGRHDAWQHMCLMRHARSRGVARMCYRRLLPPPSWCGVLMAGRMS